jgi:hypothetical protein
MAITKSGSRLTRHHERRNSAPRQAFAVATLIAFAGSAAATMLLPHDLAPAAISTLFFALAAAVAVAGLGREPADRNALSHWDVAGALTFVGIFAAALVDPEQLVRLVEGDGRAQ